MMGIARIAVAYGDSLKEDVFKDHVGRVSVKAIIRAAKERRPGALGYSEAMIIEYNKKSKFRLSLKTLYGGKADLGRWMNLEKNNDKKWLPVPVVQGKGQNIGCLAITKLVR